MVSGSDRTRTTERDNQQPLLKKAGMDATIDDADWKCLSLGAWAGEIAIRLLFCVIFSLLAEYFEPFLRYVEVHDWPRHNFPHADPQTIEAEVVFITICIIPFLMVIICSCIQPGWRETYSYGENEGKARARIKRRVVTEFLIGIMAASLAYLSNGIITDVIKITYGRPRPDFLSRCFTPTAISDNPNTTFTQANGENLWITLPSRAYPRTNTPAQLEALRRFGENGTDRLPGDVAFPFIEDVKSMIDRADCINQKDKLLRRGGRRSFPSGHTSFAFAGATFCALYSYYWLGKLKTRMNLGRPGVNFPGASVKLGMFCLWYVPAIYVGISRTQDYRHHPGDVFGGAIIGTLTTFACFLQYYNIRGSHQKLKRRTSDQGSKCPQSVHPANGNNPDLNNSNNLSNLAPIKSQSETFRERNISDTNI